MIVTVTSMKGGVGKTTIAAMLARYLSLQSKKEILVIDMDPQGGASSLLLGGRIDPPTLVDILQMEAEGLPGGELLRQSARRSRHDEGIHVVPGHAGLAGFANSDPPLDCLKNAIESAALAGDAVQIVDTGTHPALVAMGIIAADLLLVPVMFSQQTARPTINTLKAAILYNCRRGALLPMGIGNAGWEARELERWKEQLQTNRALIEMGFTVLSGMPYSRIILRGRWRYGRFPKSFAPIMEGIRSFVFQEPASGGTLEKEIGADGQECDRSADDHACALPEYTMPVRMEAAHGG